MASSEGRRRGLPPETARPRRAVLAALIVFTLAAAVAAAVPAASLWGRHAAGTDRDRLSAAATEVALLLSSLSADRADAQLGRLAELTTGELHAQMTRRRDEVLREVDRAEVRADAEVIATGVELDVAPGSLRNLLPGTSTGEPPRAVLLVATRARVDNAAGARDAERTWRWRLDAVIEDGRALVSAAEVAV